MIKSGSTSSLLERRLIQFEASEKDAHDSPKLRSATIHRAKGLEFDQVLVLAQKASLEGEDADHNRKLAYVALTRAKKVAALLQF